MPNLRRSARRAALAAALVVAASACTSEAIPATPPAGPLAEGVSATNGRGGSQGIPSLDHTDPKATYTVDDILPTLLTTPIRIQSITLARPIHTTLIGAYVISNGDGQIGISRDYPPDGLPQEPERAAAWRRKVPSHGALLRPGIEYDLIVGMRLTPHATSGSAAYAIIDYTQHGKQYRLGTPLSLILKV